MALFALCPVRRDRQFVVVDDVDVDKRLLLCAKDVARA
jgi:hypothetical protein